MSDWTVENRPQTNDAYMIVAFKGWNDAGSAASYAVEHLVDQLGAQHIARLDPDEYFDFTEARPVTRAAGKYRRELTWPGNNLYHVRMSSGRDLLLMVGTEPHLRWKRYARELADLAEQFNVTEVLALGALLADTPHTRPVPLSGGAGSEDFGNRLKREGVKSSGYEGPTGILSVFSVALDERNIPNGSIWASVPHYISASPNPKASAAILEKLNRLLPLNVSIDKLNTEAIDYDSEIEAALRDNPEAQQYVRQLEMRDPLLGLPSPAEDIEEEVDDAKAEGLIRSIEEYLRDREKRQGNEPDTR